MFSQHMKKCSAPVAIKEVKMKTAVRSPLAPVRLATINKSQQQMLVMVQGIRNPHTQLLEI
jgi:hypothetical protein